MRKAIIGLSSLFMLAGIGSALNGQDAYAPEGWYKSGVFSLNIAQGSFTNWAAGDQDSVAIKSLINLSGYRKTDKSLSYA